MIQVETLRARVLGWAAAALGTIGFAALLLTIYSEIASKGDPVTWSYNFVICFMPGLLFAGIGLLTGLAARKEGVRHGLIGIVLSIVAIAGLVAMRLCAAWLVGGSP